MKTTKLLIVALMFVLSNTMNAANVTIGSFATGQFTVDTGGSMYTPTQSASGLTSNLTIAAGDTWYGSFNAPIDWSSYGYTGTPGNYNNNTLGLVMSVTSQAAPLFLLCLCWILDLILSKHIAGTRQGLPVRLHLWLYKLSEDLQAQVLQQMFNLLFSVGMVQEPSIRLSPLSNRQSPSPLRPLSWPLVWLGWLPCVLVGKAKSLS